jgi:TPR repeat protein
MYAWGTGVAKDETLAAQLFREAAAEGSGLAATYLGDMFYFGMGIRRDKAVAEAWYAKGVKMHDPMAEFDMASLLTVNRDHQQNLSQGVKLLRESADAGFVPAMHALGLLLTNHPELANSRQEARPLLEAAANAGSWKSSVVLGVLARDGAGDSPGPESAFYHFQIAVLQGGEPARLLLAKDIDALSGKLEDEKRNELKSAANSWFSQHKTAAEFVFKDRAHARRFPGEGLTPPPDSVHAGMLLPTPKS